eukprot:TRINITY_DN575_c0_g1_i1.p1 TRINITY_DN575_c0_g1~~TRINITY_DN575_c0_g1_i1.p1  ORF type:complete len:183 (+),score=28.79 TRINITY_DN575_c0_g1_i1:210-758(+)
MGIQKMSDKDDFNLRLERLHKTIKVKEDPNKKMKTYIQKPKPKPIIKKKPIVQPSSYENPISQEKPVEEKEYSPEPKPCEPEVAEMEVAETKHEEPIKEAPNRGFIDQTLPRNLMVKNTFSSVFPAYGVVDTKKNYSTEMKSMSDNLHEAEHLDKTNHMKMDAIKRYTEEMLKAANMRGVKK